MLQVGSRPIIATQKSVLLQTPTPTIEGFSVATGACRTANGSGGTKKATRGEGCSVGGGCYTRVYVSSVEECASECEANTHCVAFEASVRGSRTRCEMHEVPMPQATGNSKHGLCYNIRALQLRFRGSRTTEEPLCVSMSEGCDGNGVCAGHGRSDATVQNCDSTMAGQQWTYTGNQLRSNLFPNACLTVGSSRGHSHCRPLTLQECAAQEDGLQQFTKGAHGGTFTGSFFYRNTATNLYIDVRRAENNVDNTVWACPSRGARSTVFNLQ